MDWFCGAGGTSQGAHAVPGVRVTSARTTGSGRSNPTGRTSRTPPLPGRHPRGAGVGWPVTDIFWASPECTNWSIAREAAQLREGLQGDLWTCTPRSRRKSSRAQRSRRRPRTAEEEARALMEEVPLYLRGVHRAGRPGKAGVVENVTDVRAWDEWDRWVARSIRSGHRTKVIALNSMHADPRAVHRAPQSATAYTSGTGISRLGRTPDWDKWLRPRAWCSGCGMCVQAIQVFKTPGRDMGRYRQQYVYRCPTACRNQIVEPEVLPAAVAIDWSIPGSGSATGPEPLADKTLARIEAGLDEVLPARTDRSCPRRHVAGCGDQRLRANAGRTTRENDALMVPPLIVPVEGREGKKPAAQRATAHQTTRNESRAGMAAVHRRTPRWRIGGPVGRWSARRR